MTAYYNEIDPFAAAWLRELIKAGHIAPGDVDERSIEDVVPSELMGYSQCHFFAGIGVWSYALRQAGWPDDRPVWTGSCPCQPFSAAGKKGGTSDKRHLWPAFEWLIRQCRPDVIFGEQVEAAIKHDWLDHVALSLEGIGYTVGAIGFPACSVGAPHIRQRLYWVADSATRGQCGRSENGTGEPSVLFRAGSCTAICVAEIRVGDWSGYDHPTQAGWDEPTSYIKPIQLADAEHSERRTEHQEQRETHGGNGPGRSGNAGVLGDSEKRGRGEFGDEARQGGSGHADGAEQYCQLGDSEPTGFQEQRGDGRVSRSQNGAAQGKAVERTGSPTNGFWSSAEWIACRDGKNRPVEPGFEQMVDGLACELGLVRLERRAECEEQGEEVTIFAPLVAKGKNRVGRLKGYGNAIVAPAAIEFIRAFMEK